MGRAAIPRDGSRVRPWFVRAVDLSPLGPAPTGVCVAGVLLAVNLAAYAGERLDLLLFMPIGIGYLLAVAPLSIRALARDVRDLRPLLRCSGDVADRLEASVGRYPPALLRSATLAGVAFAVALGLAVGPDLYGPDLWRPSPWFGLLIGESTFFWALMVPVIALVVADGRRLRRIGREWLSPPLFEPDLLAPFGRAGLRGALIVLVVFAVRILFYALDAPRTLVLANLGPMVVFAGLATAALGLPALGAREALRRAKSAELARVREALDAHPFAPGRSLDDGVPRAWLDLLEYRDRVEGVREWPLDAPALFRFAIYLLIPALGWVGGALVERLLSLFLD